ncbi:16 kDa beta-galactoside-binding lectin, partial [Varanus komodoensis]
FTGWERNPSITIIQDPYALRHHPQPGCFTRLPWGDELRAALGSSQEEKGWDISTNEQQQQQQLSCHRSCVEHWVSAPAGTDCHSCEPPTWTKCGSEGDDSAELHRVSGAGGQSALADGHRCPLFQVPQSGDALLLFSSQPGILGLAVHVPTSLAGEKFQGVLYFHPPDVGDCNACNSQTVALLAGDHGSCGRKQVVGTRLEMPGLCALLCHRLAWQLGRGLARKGWAVLPIPPRLPVCGKGPLRVTISVCSHPLSFEVNLGKDCDNLILHFNPRFNCKGDMNTIVCNSKRDGVWGEEERETKFPFEQGGKFQASFNFASSEIKVTLPEDQVICFPNLLDLDVIDYIEVAGDFKIKVLKFP